MATDALVSVVVEELCSIAKDRLSSLFGVENEVNELSDTFSAIQAVLEDAERHQVTNKRVRDWLLELKEVAYEVEDILDEWLTDASKSQEDEDETRHPKRVRLSFFPLVQYVKQVKLQYDIGQRIRKTTEKLNRISIKKDKFNLRELNTREDMLVPNKEERQTSSLVDESEIFGRDDFKKSIIEQLVSETTQEEKSVSVISIVGMGGLGKTTVAQLIYNDDRVMAHFEKRIWVCVSDPFDVKSIAIKVIESMGEGITSNNPDLDTLLRTLREAIDKKRFLLVLDDVWDESGRLWQKLRVPLMGAAPGSKVVVTTRSRQVAEAMETTLIHTLGVLSESDCWKLFKYKALKGTEDEECPELIETGEKIVKRCKGIPLAARALGSLLRCRRTKWYWERVLESEIWEWDISKDDGILPALLLSYYSLPLHLQQCFSFCSLFPKDYWISKDELVKLWMAHGMIKSEKAKKHDIEEIGEMYFDDLLTRSLFQDARKDNYGNIVGCKLHDLVHDLATFVSSGDYCCMGIENSELLSVNCHHLSVRLSDDVSSISSPPCNEKRLRTLLLPYDCRLAALALADSFFNDLGFLRVLDLNGVRVKNIPSSLGNLKHLRYLSLCHSYIKELPEFVTDLCNLQTLKLNSCESLCILPRGMSKMVKLRHLEIQETGKLLFLPNGLGRLTSLRTLCKFPLGDENRGCKIRELKDLNLLRGELSINNLERVMNVNDAREAELHKKSDLHLLSLCCNDKSNEEWKTLEDDEMERMDSVLEGLRPPHSNLKGLKIENYAGSKFPSWLEDSKFSSLVQVLLVNCRKCMLLPGLGKLHSLKYLKIIGADEVKVVGGDQFYGNVDDAQGKETRFPKLEELHFESMLNWEEWKLTQEYGEVMPYLKKLVILNCKKLKATPTWLPSTLREVTIENCNEVIWAHDNPLPHLLHLTLKNVGGMSSKPLPYLTGTALMTLEIHGFSCESLPSDGWGLPESLLDLRIFSCPKLASLHEGLGQLKALQTLHIKDCERLLSLPEGLGQLKALQTLHIKNCERLSSLPEGLGQLKALQTLRIENCERLSSLPEGLGQLKALQTLHIRYCKRLSYLPEGLGQLKALQTMHIESLSSLPEGLGQLKALQILEIFHCEQLSSLPEGLGQLKALQTLKIFNCKQLSYLPEGLGQLKALQTLKIFHCEQLSSLPEGLGQLKALQTLEIFNCEQLSSLPEGLGQLKALQTLSIDNCKRLSSLPEGLGQLKAFQTLSIKNCERLSSLPEGLGQLEVLQTLHIENCERLSSLPEGLGQVKALQTLNFEGLSSLPEGLGHLEALQTLRIENCERLSSLPEGLGQLKALETLYIHNCRRLSSLPEGLGQLKALQALYIENCEILSSLPEELGQLKALQTLHVENCKILSSLPEGLGQLKALQILKIWGCERLSSLFDGFEQLKSLRRLDIWDCPQLCPLPNLQHLTALERLSIQSCPLLTERLEKEKGEDWCKISHIPSIDIDDGVDDDREYRHSTMMRFIRKVELEKMEIRSATSSLGNFF